MAAVTATALPKLPEEAATHMAPPDRLAADMAAMTATALPKLPEGAATHMAPQDRLAADMEVVATAIAARIPKPASSWRRLVACSEVRAWSKRAVRCATSPEDMAMTPVAITKE